MRRNLLLAALLSCTLAAPAQVRSFQGHLGGDLGISIPQGEFADAWGHNMVNLGGQLTLPSRLLPFQWGFAFDYSAMGGARRTVPVARPELTATEGKLAVNAKVMSYHPLLRFSPSKGKVRPYVDGMVGFRQFTTKSTVTVDGLHEPIMRERNANDFALSTGWAAGLMVTWGGIGYVEARVERFYSGKASYVDPSSIEVDDQGAVGFGTKESGTGALNLMVGVGLRF